MKFIFLILLMTRTAWAAAPELLQPTSMGIDAGNKITTQSLDFFDHPQSGTVNFSPSNYIVNLPGGIKLPVQDVVPYSGIVRASKDCQDFVGHIKSFVDSFVGFAATLSKLVGAEIDFNNNYQADSKKFFSQFLELCNLNPQAIDSAVFGGQIVADVRNASANSTQVVFSGEAVDPYPDFPVGMDSSTGTVVTIGNDVGNDGFVVGTLNPILTGGSQDIFTTPLLSSGLLLYRFVPNAAQKKVLQLNSYSSAWFDRPLADAAGKPNSQCFTANPADPKKPFIKPDAELIKAGCVGENIVTGVVALNFYGHASDKMKDLVVVSRSRMGDSKDVLARRGYLTLYKRNDALPAPAAHHIFQDIWQFDKSVTVTTNPQGLGIPEPNAIAALQNSLNGKTTESVVVTSNIAIGNQYFIYRYANGMLEPIAIPAGCVNATPNCNANKDFGPHRIYSADLNGDGCGDIALTRAKVLGVANNQPAFAYANYFEAYLQQKAGGVCLNIFDKGAQYSITQPANQPQAAISSLAIADINKDGLLDVMVGDNQTYADPTTKAAVNYAHFLEGLGGGLLNSLINLPRFVVNTKSHDATIGVIDIKADRHANIGVVTGVATAFAPPPLPSPCVIDPATGFPDPNKVDVGLCAQCRQDGDNDGIMDLLPNQAPLMVGTCENGIFLKKPMDIANNLPFTYSPDCKQFETRPARYWMRLWAGCDNCTVTIDKCTGPEAGAPAGIVDTCWNKSQLDTDEDGYGDICSAGAVAPAKPPPVGAQKFCADGKTAFDESWLDKNTVKFNAAGEMSMTTTSGGNDLDRDGIPDCKIILDKNLIKVQDCTKDCDSCSPQANPAYQCAGPENSALCFDKSLGININCEKLCANPSQTNAKQICPNSPQASIFKPTLHEDKMMAWDEDPVIAYQKELQPVAGGNLVDNGHEVTILLNKSLIQGTPGPCVNGDLACICQQNPDLLACQCQKDPNAPGCTTPAAPQVNCCLDVCRGDLTSPFPAMCDFIRPFNDRIRQVTGLCMDVLVPAEGTQYHLSCTMPNAPALDLGSGMAYTQVFKTGQIPKNYFKDWRKPVADQNVLKDAVLLNSPDAILNIGVPLDINKLPKTNFNFEPLLSVVPDATVHQAPGIAQIDGVMQIETYLADVGPTGAVSVNSNIIAGAGKPTKALLLDIKGYSSPPGCQWSSSECPSPMRNPPSPQAFVDAISAKVAEYQAAGKPITMDAINDAFKSMDVGPAFMHQEFIFANAQGNVTAPLQTVMGGSFSEGGCGCSITAISTTTNTVVPLLLSAIALAAMLTLRRSTAKKH